MSWNNYITQNHDRFFEEYCDLVRIPSVSSLPEHAADVRRAAEWVANRLTAAGLENAEVMETGGHPVVYADWLHAGEDKPTVLIYGHFDVQPVDPVDLWDSPPFEPTIRDGRVYARGASDDKGGMVTPIFAMESLMQSEGALPLNIKCCFEGQEEIGSPQLNGFLETHAAKFQADLVVNSDGLLSEPDRGMILLGLKGLAGLQIDVKGPNSDLHSGLHGGVIQNPIEALSQIIASLRDQNGRIAVKGFYDDVVDLNEDAREAIATVPFDEAGYAQTLGVNAFFGEPGYSTRERNWIRPTLELNGIYGGFQGEGTKTVIPSEAHAKITCRLVANQDPKKVVSAIIEHIVAHAPVGVEVTVIPIEGSHPYLVSADHPGNVIAAGVMEELFGKPAYNFYVGGSIPIVTYFKRYLGAESVNFGWTSMDENLHAPNEFFRIENFGRGIQGYCMLLHELAENYRD